MSNNDGNNRLFKHLFCDSDDETVHDVVGGGERADDNETSEKDDDANNDGADDFIEDDFDDLNAHRRSDHRDRGDEETSDEEDSYDADGMDDFLEDDIGDFSARRLNKRNAFRQECEALKQNDPDYIHVRLGRLAGGRRRGKHFGDALQGNTFVQSLELDITNYSGGRYLAQDSVEQEMGLLLKYLSEGPALRFVQLDAVSKKDNLPTGPFLQSIALHQHIDSLKIWVGVDILDEDWAHLLRSTKSIKTLILGVAVSGWRTAEALEANRTIETILFDHNVQTQDMTVLNALVAHPTLRCLQFGDWNHERMDVPFFSEYLEHTRGLTNLNISGQHFDRNRVLCLIEGLQANRSLTSLCLAAFIVDADAIDPLKSMLRSTVISDGNNGDLADFAPIRELELDYGHCAATDQGAALLVLTCRKHLRACSLSGSRYYAGGEFWNTIQEYSSSCEFRLHLQTMRIACLQNSPLTDRLALCSCLPLLPSLQEFHVDGDPETRGKRYRRFLRRFARAVCKSGSLRVVTVAGDFPTFWDDTETRMVKAALERNRALPELLSSSTAPTNEPALDATGALVPSKPTMQAPSKLIPDLFTSAMASPPVTPNSITMGLLSLSEGIGVGTAVGDKRT